MSTWQIFRIDRKANVCKKFRLRQLCDKYTKESMSQFWFCYLRKRDVVIIPEAFLNFAWVT